MGSSVTGSLCGADAPAKEQCWCVSCSWSEKAMCVYYLVARKQCLLCLLKAVMTVSFHLSVSGTCGTMGYSVVGSLCSVMRPQKSSVCAC